MLVYPDMVLLDLVGPQTVLSIAGAEIHLVARDTVPVTTDVGVAVAPTTLFAECPAALGFLHDRGAGARFVTSVCTGSLLLGVWSRTATGSPVLASPPGSTSPCCSPHASRASSRAKPIQLALEYDPASPAPADRRPRRRRARGPGPLPLISAHHGGAIGAGSRNPS